MLLNISHTSTYTYDAPVPYALQRLRLTPQSNRSQTVHDWKVTCEGAQREVAYRDGFNNPTDLILVKPNALEMVITAHGSVTTKDTSGVLGDDKSNPPLWIYGRQTPLTMPGDNIKQLANDVGAKTDKLACLHDLMAAIAKAMVFEPGQTDVETTAEVALTSGHGVCQDHAHTLISAARELGMLARYVSGYLMIPDVTNQAASHAWAEVHVNGLGWVGFDPANLICPNDKYVRIAIGLDYHGAAPISGIRHGSAAEMLDVAVKVEQ
jgi:transglutaminase-like putative cysteine protease